MPRKLDDTLDQALKDAGLGQDAVWDCHGTWIAYHWALEAVAADKGIAFDPPQIIQTDLPNKVIAIQVSGRLGDKAEWSIGEAAPYNNKNSYPAAMAEKRAKDRVILKLIGLSGKVYSEEEADDFKATPDATTDKQTSNFIGITDLKQRAIAFGNDIDSCSGLDQFIALKESHAELIEEIKQKLPRWWEHEEGGLGQKLAQTEEAFLKQERMTA